MSTKKAPKLIDIGPLVGPLYDDNPDIVARRIIMDRSTWDRCVALCEQIKRARPESAASPSDIARVALEEGLKFLERRGP